MLKLYIHCLYKLRKIFYENYFGKLYTNTIVNLCEIEAL